MKRILRTGIDVHSTNYTLCTIEPRFESQGFHYTKGKRTQAHIKWLRTIELGEMDRETLNEYLTTYEYQTNWIETFDKRIEELASETEYVEKVKKRVCFLGVKTHTALSCLVETGDLQKEIFIPHIWG